MIAIYLGIIFNIVILSYINKLEGDKCDCANEGQIKYISYAILTISLLSIFKTPVIVKNLIIIVLFSCYFYQLYSLLIFLNKLKKSGAECDCSKDWRREFIYYVTILYITFISVFVLKLLYTGIRYSTMTNGEKSNVNTASLIQETSKSNIIINRDLQKLLGK
jgi:hypothetical protein